MAKNLYFAQAGYYMIGDLELFKICQRKYSIPCVFRNRVSVPNSNTTHANYKGINSQS